MTPPRPPTRDEARGVFEILETRHGQGADYYRQRPVEWATEVAGFHPWSVQVEVMESVRDHPETVVSACHGIGKSAVAAVIVAWWIDTHPVGDAFVVTTAPTYRQVKNILWREIRRVHNRSNLKGYTNQVEWMIGDSLVAFGASPADHDPDAFQGIHELYVLVVLDEGCGVASPLWVAADSIATNDDSRKLAIGNPDDATADFYKACQPGSGWNALQVAAHDSPNFTGETISDDPDTDATIKAKLVGKTYVERAGARWGEDSAIYRSKVLGQFTEDANDGVILGSAVTRCKAREDEPGEPVTLGVDVGASADGDATVVREWRGNVAGDEWTTLTADPEQLMGFLIGAIRESGATLVVVDSIGVGWGILGSLRTETKRLGLDAQVEGFSASESARDKSMFKNQRAELWWSMRERTQAGEVDLSRVDDDTISELLTPRYKLDASGRVQVESKDDIRKRLDGRSTDHADALLMGAWTPRSGKVRVDGGTSDPAPVFVPSRR